MYSAGVIKKLNFHSLFIFRGFNNFKVMNVFAVCNAKYITCSKTNALFGFQHSAQFSQASPCIVSASNVDTIFSGL